MSDMSEKREFDRLDEFLVRNRPQTPDAPANERAALALAARNLQVRRSRVAGWPGWALGAAAAAVAGILFGMPALKDEAQVVTLERERVAETVSFAVAALNDAMDEEEFLFNDHPLNELLED